MAARGGGFWQGAGGPILGAFVASGLAGVGYFFTSNDDAAGNGAAPPALESAETEAKTDTPPQVDAAPVTTTAAENTSSAPVIETPAPIVAVSNARFEVKRSYPDQGLLVSLRFTLDITNTSSAPIEVLPYFPDKESIAFVFAGGGSIGPQFSSSNLGIKNCRTRKADCRLKQADRYTTIRANDTLSLESFLAGTLSGGSSQKLEDVSTGMFKLSLLINDGGAVDQLEHYALREIPVDVKSFR